MQLQCQPSVFMTSFTVKPQLIFGRDEEIDTLVLAASFER